MSENRKAYGTWSSPISADVVVGASKGYSGLRAHGGDLFWIETRPDEGGRATLIQRSGGATRELTQAPFNVRSRVHEYGGGAYCVAVGGVDGDHVYSVDFKDQNVHAVALADASPQPRQVTRGDASERFADLFWDGAAVLAVRETHGGGEAVNDLVRIDPASGAVAVLHRGHDFYAAPRSSADGRLAFLVWDHPNMPWDGTQLMVADYDGVALSNATVVAGGAAESIVQPTWCESKLLFASDASGYWNLYAYDRSGVYCLLAEAAEYAGPAWQFASTYFVPIGVRHVVARRIADGEPSLVVVDLEHGLASPLHSACSAYSDIVRTAAGVAFLAGFPDRATEIAELKLDDGAQRVVASPGERPVPASAISAAERITFDSTNGAAYAFYYPPRNADQQGLPGELPPLLVTTHGGPTSASNGDLSWRIQFYTSRGWAVVDVNYRGSTGYGRVYRTSLNGAWGITDVEDCVACVRHLVAQGRVDRLRVAIRGGSAGGYTTLAALAFSDVFKAGASHYGIGDLRALDRDTHKFESRYVGTLVGGDDAMAQRSPINHVGQLGCSVIFFQGAEDKIVPPNQAEAMRDALLAKGIDVGYELFEGEGHGFRRAENMRRVVEAEYVFLAGVFGIPT